MARNTPKGDKTHVNNDKNAKKSSQRSKDEVKQSKESDSSCSDVSFDSMNNDLFCYDEDFDNAANFDMLQKHLKNYYDQKLLLLKCEFDGKVNALHDVIKNKDEVIGNLHTEIGELKQCCNFLSNETASLQTKIKKNETSLEISKKDHDDLVLKTSDLEDRSRRNNVVFYNFPEKCSQQSEAEDCEKMLIDFLKGRGFFQDDYTLEIDRAHRLGRRRNDLAEKPRPIIARFSFFQDKDKVIKNGRLLRGCDINVSEDFSKQTLTIHKELRSNAKDAQNKLSNDDEQDKNIVSFKVTYKRVLMTYKSKTDISSPTFNRSFNLDYIKSNKNWYLPPKRNTYNNVRSS